MIKLLLPREAKKKGFLTLTILVPFFSDEEGDEFGSGDGVYYDKSYIATIAIEDIVAISVSSGLKVVTSKNTYDDINTEDNRITITSLSLKGGGEIQTLASYSTIYNALYGEQEITLTSN